MSITNYYSYIINTSEKKSFPKCGLEDFIKHVKKNEEKVSNNIMTIVLVAILHINYNTLKFNNRKKDLETRKRKYSENEDGDDNDDEAQDTNDDDEQPDLKKRILTNGTNQSSKNNKSITKATCVPECYLSLNTMPALIAVAWYCLAPNTELARGNVISKILQKTPGYTTVPEILELSKSKIETKPLSFEKKDVLISMFMHISHLLKDRSAARFAMLIDKNVYFQMCREFAKDETFKSIIPFHSLVDDYIDFTVAKYEKNNERAIISNRFKENQLECVEYMVKKIPDIKNEEKSNQFNDKTEYYVYLNKTKKNYANKIIVSGTSTGHIIQLKDDCLYDVLSCNGEVFTSLSWPERLEKYDYGAKVTLKKMTGTELNNLKFENEKMREITVSWIEDDVFQSKIVTIINKKHKDVKL